MNLFWKEFFRGRKYWVSVIFPGSLALAIIDYVRPDLYFDGFFVKIWLLFWGSALLYHYIKVYIDPPILRWNDWLEKKREERVRKMVKQDPDYQTLCHHCKEFDQENLFCTRLRKNKRVKWIKIEHYDNKDYCLYWRIY